MLERLVELQRMVCHELDSKGRRWYEHGTAYAVEEGLLVTKKSHSVELAANLSESNGWEHLPIWMTTDDNTKYLCMSASYPILEEEISASEEIVVLPAMTLYVQIDPAPSKAVQPSAKVPEVAKPRPRKLEFI